MPRPVRRLNLVLAIPLVAALCTIGATSNGADDETPPYHIGAIKALLFYNQTADFSENIIDNPDFMLWNVGIGEGSAKGPSDATLVVVEVVGAPGAYQPDRRVQLVATEGGKVRFKRTFETGVLSDDGKYHAGFWLYGTGWQPIELVARILGQAEDSEIKKAIEFQSGE